MGAVDNTRYITNAGWADVPHLSLEEQKHLEAITPAHLLPAAKYGLPVSSVGRIYPWDFGRITVDPFKMPSSWPRIYGFDPSTNNTAALWAAHDEDQDTVYLYGEYFGTHHVPRLHAQSIQMRGAWVPGMADPSVEGKLLDGRKVMDIYRGLGLQLRIADNAVKAGFDAIIDRVTTGRLKAFSTLGRLRFEWNNYRRDKNGKVIKENDHLLDDLRYICLGGLRHACVDPRWLDQRTDWQSSDRVIADPVAGF